MPLNSLFGDNRLNNLSEATVVASQAVLDEVN
jgi:hypothetical protein